MRLKLDENLGQREADILRADGHDVRTVFEQELCSTPDPRLIELCAAEGRCLVTLDLDFANPLLFPPPRYRGIAVLRLPARASQVDLWDIIRTLAAALRLEPIDGKLWIVQRGRIRHYRPEAPPP